MYPIVPALIEILNLKSFQGNYKHLMKNVFTIWKVSNQFMRGHLETYQNCLIIKENLNL